MLAEQQLRGGDVMVTAMHRREKLMSAAVAALLALATVIACGAMPSTAHAQRAVIIVDGERVEIEFEDDEVEALRQQLNRHFQDRPVNHRNQQFRHMPAFEVDLPTDEQLRSVEVDPALLTLVSDLNSDCYETREQATGRLLDAQHENVQFYAILARHELTTEQRSRLLKVVQRRLIHAPRGAVGISMRPHVDIRTGATHVEVVDLVEGLPAERVLQLGDRITHLDGQPLESTDQLTVTVQSKRPGEQVTLSILRPRRDDRGRPLNVGGNQTFDELQIDLTLGSAELLDRASTAGTVNNAVEHMRRRKAQALIERFAPNHAAVIIDSDLISRHMPSDTERARQRSLARRVELHPIITNIQQQLRILEESGADPPAAIRAKWRETEFILQEQINFAELSDEHRAVLEAVLERFRELQNQ
jgi:hypothetical protein